jgi:predicted DsbA family dithiol-disulfide isomerase
VVRKTGATVHDVGRATVTATVWSDYICPWCYLGHDRTSLMRELGVEVTSRPFELHPETPATGYRVRPGGRLSQVFDRVAAECDELGLPFRAPTVVPNSRRALATAEAVRVGWPEAFAALDQTLFTAHWVDGRDLGDPETLDSLVDAAGAPTAAVGALVESGEAGALVDASMAEARDHGIVSTPSWLLDEGLVIPGAQPRATVERWVTRVKERR